MTEPPTRTRTFHGYPIGVILVFPDSIEVRQMHHNGFNETSYSEPTVENLNDAARVLGRWMELNRSHPEPKVLIHSLPVSEAPDIVSF